MTKNNSESSRVIRNNCQFYIIFALVYCAASVSAHNLASIYFIVSISFDSEPQLTQKCQNRFLFLSKQSLSFSLQV